MQKLLLSLLAIILTTGISFSQITEKSVAMSQGTRNAISIELPGVDEKLAGKVWKGFTKDFYGAKTKWDRKSGEYLTQDAKIAALSYDGNVILRALPEAKGDNVDFMLWIDMGNAFVTSDAYPDQYKEAEKMLLKFGIEVARERLKIQLKDEEKTLADLENDLEKLAKDKDSYESTIEKAKEMIKKAEEDIKNNAKDQEKKNSEIENQKKMIKEVEKKIQAL